MYLFGVFILYFYISIFPWPRPESQDDVALDHSLCRGKLFISILCEFFPLTKTRKPRWRGKDHGVDEIFIPVKKSGRGCQGTRPMLSACNNTEPISKVCNLKMWYLQKPCVYSNFISVTSQLMTSQNELMRSTNPKN